MIVLALIVIGCVTQDGGNDLRTALLDSVTAEQVAWMQNTSRPAGLESVVALTTITARVDSITFASANDAVVLATYKYTGRLRNGTDEREGTITVRRRLHFAKAGNQWVQRGTPEEIARK